MTIFDEIDEIADMSHIPKHTRDAQVLEQRITWEDAREDAGKLRHDDRLTCHTCREWATADHLASPAHERRLAAAAEQVLLSDRAQALAHGDSRRTAALAFVRSLSA